MSESLTNTFFEKLLNISTQKEQYLFDSIADVIQTNTRCQMCSLWSINSNNTIDGFESASLMVRKLEKGITHSPNNKEDFVQCLRESANERFHASGGVFPQTVLCGFGSLSPARTFVEPPPA